jgi:hypothetical protein
MGRETCVAGGGKLSVKRLNGWQRIGVLASIAWFIGMWAHVSNVQRETYVKEFRFSYGACRDALHDLIRNECGARAAEYAEEMCCYGSRMRDPSRQSWASWFMERNQSQIAAAAGLIPVWWLLAYIGVWLTRWVRRGFAKSHSQ